MKEAIKILKEEFIKLHGTKKLSIDHNFIATEKSRKNGYVIVGYSPTSFNDSATTSCRFLIPEEDWNDETLFITVYNSVNDSNFTLSKGGHF